MSSDEGRDDRTLSTKDNNKENYPTNKLRRVREISLCKQQLRKSLATNQQCFVESSQKRSQSLSCGKERNPFMIASTAERRKSEPVIKSKNHKFSSNQDLTSSEDDADDLEELNHVAIDENGIITTI
jgi:hypothetical protein